MDTAAGTAATPLQPDKPRRPWYQFSLRTLLIVVTLAAVALGGYVVAIGPCVRRHAVVERLEALGEQIIYADIPADESWPARTLRKYVPRDWLDDVVGIGLANPKVRDADLAGFGSFTQLHVLSLNETQITDAGLTHLQGLSQLQTLYLGRAQVTDAGLAHVQGLTQLQSLVLDGTPITAAGLAHLQGLTQLRSLSLGRTQVTDAGLVHLKGLTQLQSLNLSDTQVTDAGLEYLQGLKQLQSLGLRNAQVTGKGIRRLKTSLPGCEISH